MEPRVTLTCDCTFKRMERKTDCAAYMYIYTVDVPFTFLICPDFNSRLILLILF